MASSLPKDLPQPIQRSILEDRMITATEAKDTEEIDYLATLGMDLTTISQYLGRLIVQNPFPEATIATLLRIRGINREYLIDGAFLYGDIRRILFLERYGISFSPTDILSSGLHNDSMALIRLAVRRGVSIVRIYQSESRLVSSTPQILAYLLNQIPRHLRQGNLDQGLKIAVRKYPFDIVQFFMERGAQNAKLLLGDAVKRNKIEIIRYLLDHGAEPLQGIGNLSLTGNLEVLHLLVERSGFNQELVRAAQVIARRIQNRGMIDYLVGVAEQGEVFAEEKEEE